MPYPQDYNEQVGGCLLRVVVAIICIFFIAICSLIFFDRAKASTIQLIYPTSTIQKGQEFEVTALIIPERSNYTVSLNMCFQNAEFQGFEQSNEWLQLRVPKYWETNQGMIARTAGFPGGFNTSTVFGKFIFKATEDGLIDVSVNSSTIILDRDNKNVYEMYNTP